MPKLLNKRKDKNTAGAVYIGRGSKWGNPFVIGTHGTRAQVIEKYKVYLLNNPALLSTIEELRGKDLLCFCSPLPCHGDVLFDILESQKEK